MYHYHQFQYTEVKELEDPCEGRLERMNSRPALSHTSDVLLRMSIAASRNKQQKNTVLNNVTLAFRVLSNGTDVF